MTIDSISQPTTLFQALRNEYPPGKNSLTLSRQKSILSCLAIKTNQAEENPHKMRLISHLSQQTLIDSENLRRAEAIESGIIESLLNERADPCQADENSSSFFESVVKRGISSHISTCLKIRKLFPFLCFLKLDKFFHDNNIGNNYNLFMELGQSYFQLMEESLEEFLSLLPSPPEEGSPLIDSSQIIVDDPDLRNALESLSKTKVGYYLLNSLRESSCPLRIEREKKSEYFPKKNTVHIATTPLSGLAIIKPDGSIKNSSDPIHFNTTTMLCHELTHAFQHLLHPESLSFLNDHPFPYMSNARGKHGYLL